MRDGRRPAETSCDLSCSGQVISGWRPAWGQVRFHSVTEAPMKTMMQPPPPSRRCGTAVEHFRPPADGVFTRTCPTPRRLSGELTLPGRRLNGRLASQTRDSAWPFGVPRFEQTRPFGGARFTGAHAELRQAAAVHRPPPPVELSGRNPQPPACRIFNWRRHRGQPLGASAVPSRLHLPPLLVADPSRGWPS